MYGRDRFNRVAPRHKKTRALIRMAQCRETLFGAPFGAPYGCLSVASGLEGRFTLKFSHPTGFFGSVCHGAKNRYISAARANYRKLPLGRLLLVALPGCMPSLEQPGQPGAEIRVLRHQRHSTDISVIGRLTHP